MIGLPGRAGKGESNCDEFERQVDLCREVYVHVLQVKLAPERRDRRELSEDERLYVHALLESLRRLGRKRGGTRGRAALDLCAAVESELLECHKAASTRATAFLRGLLGSLIARRA